MRKFLLLLGSLGLTGTAAYAQAPATPAPAAAAAPAPLPAAQRAAALDLLVAMQTEQQLAGQIDLVLASQKATQEQLLAKSPELKDQVAAMQTEMRQFYQKALGWESVKDDMIQAYGSTFTADELHSLTAFYRSKTGQMLVRKQPEATRLVAAATQRRMMALMPELQRLMKARMDWGNIQKNTPKMPGQ